MTRQRVLSTAAALVLPRLPWIVGASWALVVLLWLLDVSGHGLPAALSRLAVVVAALALAALVVRALARLWAGQGSFGTTEGRLLLGLLALAGAVHFVGLGHELTTMYFGDEGIYRARAALVDQGQVLFGWFIYPHLLIYLEALACWLVGLFRTAVTFAAHLLYGVAEPDALDALVTRGITAGLGALTVVPVFAIARRLAGTAAAALAGLLAVLCPLYVQVSHLSISDGPSAFFATLTLVPVAALLERERTRDYLLAGLCAGLAAGSKYPAGTVAVAIVAPYLYWRLRTRRLGGGLLWAGLAAIAAFLATTPSLLVFRDAAFGGGADLLFGFRQYARGGWTGVVRSSNALYYLDLLRSSFGTPALLVGALGLTFAGRAVWSRLAWMLAFPAAHLALILSMQMAVPRNLQPALPSLAVLLGIGLAAWLPRLAGWRAPASRVATAVLLSVALLPPLWGTLVTVVQLARANTRDVATAWILAHLPPGSTLVQEDYTPRIYPPELYPSVKPRFINRLDRRRLRSPEFDFVFLASDAYSRFLSPQNIEDPHHDENVLLYREIFATFPHVRDFPPGLFRRGPLLRLFKVDPDPIPYVAQRAFGAADALASDPPAMDGGDGGRLYTAPGQWSLFKEYLRPGRYRLEVDADLGAGPGNPGVRVLDRDDELIDATDLASPPAEVTLPRPDKYFFYVQLPPGSRLRGLTVSPAARPQAGS
jgi:Dolichyl-phosphate-mannose-protein mannosyltransferase